jgi:RNA polymerase sigma factor (sigma-70 family)
MSTDNPALSPEELLANAAWLQRLAARLLDPSNAEDVVQDTWTQALQAPPRTGSAVRPWLATVLRNLVRNRVRGARRWQTRARRISAADDAPLPTPEDLLAQHQAQRLVAELVAALEEPYRSTVLLCYGQGVAPSEVAERQGIPPGTVRWRLKRGIDDLRARLDARHGGDRKAWTAALAPLASSQMLLSAAARGWAVWKAAAAIVVLAGVGAWFGIRQSDKPRATAAVGSVATSVVGSASAPTGGPPRFTRPGTRPAAPGRLNPLAAASPAAGEPTQARADAIRRAMEVGDSPVRGPKDAPVTIVTFSEFQGPFCARVQATLADLLAAYPKEVRLVWRDMPLPFHESSALASEAARAAGEQGKFWEMHDRLFAHQDALAPAALTEHARALGLDVAKFQQALDSQRYRKTVEDNVRLAKEVGINGTPSFLVNGKELSGAQPLAAFQRMVEQALGRAPADAPPTGFPPLPPGPPPPAVLERITKVGNPPSKGEPTAPVTVVMFGGFQCPYSGRIQGTVAQLLVAHPKDVRFVWRNLPLPFHPNGQVAAEAAMAAHEQGKFWPMYDRLFANQNALDRASLEGHAAAIGLDVARFKAALDERRFRKAVEDDQGIAVEAGFHGTPAFLVGGARLDGAQPFERFESSVQRALAKAKGLPVPPELPAPAPPPGPPRFDPFRGSWPPPRLALPDEVLGDRLRVPFAIGDAPTLGPASAPVEVLYLVDLGCPMCGRGTSIVGGLHQSYGDAVRIVAIPVPQDPDGSPGTTFAEAAWAANAQGKFWPLHDRLFANPRGAQSREALVQEAKELGIDAAITEAVDSGRYRARVTEDLERVKDAKLHPGDFIVNGRRAEGTIALVALVDAAVKKAGRRPPPLPAPSDPPGSLNLDRYQVTLAQRFLLEPRNEASASPIEKQLAPLMERDLATIDPTAGGFKLECRTQVCRARWAPGRLPTQATRAFLQELYLGQPASRSASTPETYLSARPSMAVQGDLVTRIKSRRAGVLYGWRTGRTKIDGLPLERLPKE